METALEKKQWDAAALAAVHAAISGGDALLVAFAGMRSVEQDHKHTMILLADHLGREGKKVSRHLQRILARKKLVEYEERLIKSMDANQMANHLRRLMVLVESMKPVGKL
jgi:hypothetical protein